MHTQIYSSKQDRMENISRAYDDNQETKKPLKKNRRRRET